MLAVAALICFAIAFALKLLGVTAGTVDLVALLVIAGLGLVAGHLAHPLLRRP